MTAHTAEHKREYMLAALRRVNADLQFRIYELHEIGLALRYNMIDAETAVSWLDHIGAMGLINVEPYTNRIEIAS